MMKLLPPYPFALLDDETHQASLVFILFTFQNMSVSLALVCLEMHRRFVKSKLVITVYFHILLAQREGEVADACSLSNFCSDDSK